MTAAEKAIEDIRALLAAHASGVDAGLIVHRATKVILGVFMLVFVVGIVVAFMRGEES